MTDIRRKQCFIGVAAVIFLLMLALNIFTPRVCDDYMYCFSFETGERIESASEIIPSLIAHGKVMNGRYAPHFVVQLFNLLPLITFDIANALVYTALVIGLYLLADSKKRFDILLLIAVASALFLLPPAFGQDMLWMAGSSNYLWPAAMLVYLLIPFAKAVIHDETQVSAPIGVLLVLVGLFFGNSSENFSAAGIMMMGLCIIYQLICKKRINVWLWLTAASAAAGWLLLMAAPGNSSRLGVSGGSGGVLGFYMERFVVAWDMWLKYLTGITIAYIILLCLARHNRADGNRVAFSIGLFIAAIACNTAMTLADYFPERAILGSIVLALAACAMLAREAGGSFKPMFSALALALCFFAAVNAMQALPNNYNRDAVAKGREQTATAASAADETDFSTFCILGRSRYDAYFGLNELTDTPEYNPNVYYAKYFGLDSVVITWYEK